MAMVCALGGCASSASLSGRPAASDVLPALCSTKAPLSVPAERWSAARQELAPAGASAIRLCRYSGSNAHPRLMLLDSRLLESSSLVQQLISEFDRLPSLSGAVACPNDDLSQILAVLAYPAGQQVTITVGLTGCALVTNGSIHRTAAGVGSPPAFGPQVVAQLERLVAARPRSNPGSASTLARGHWSVLARWPLGTRYAPVVVWDGHQVLEFGGTAGPPYGGGAPQDTGAAYDPADARWRRVASVPTVVEPINAASVWTGHQVFVFGGPPSSHELGLGCCVAGLYNPASDRWTVSAKGPFGQLNQPAAVWNGEEVILAGLIGSANHSQLEVASYDPATDTWTELNPPISALHPPLALAMVDTNDGVLLWSLWGRGQPTGPASGVEYSGVDVFRLRASGTWINVTGSWPQHHTVDEPVFTGQQILLAPGQIWCGLCSHPGPFNEHGYLVDPRTLRLTAIPPGPLDDLGPQIIWTGAAEISLNAGGEITGPSHVRVLPGDIAIWNPQTRRWTRGPRAPRQLIYDAAAVWSGGQLFALAQDGHLLAYDH
ncbi:MAG: hypothetical protein ACLP8S_10540 [Solirubrobacteraceae bacterium]